MKRTWLVDVAMVLSSLALLAGPSPLYAQAALQESPPAGTMDSASMSPAFGHLSPTAPIGYGINIHENSFSPDEYALFHMASFGLIRTDFHWQDIENTAGVYDFKKYDAQLDQLDTMGVRPVWVMSYTNTNYDKNLPPYTETGWKAFARFAGAAAAHFRHRGVIWEIWNEPNEPNFWAGNPNADQYAALVKATVPAIRAVDPDATILAGAISQIDLPYITRFLQAHPLDGVTAFSIHPYRNGKPESVLSDYAKVRGLLTQYTPPGQKQTPIVCSEWGYTTADGQTSEDDQSRYIVRMYLANLLSGVNMTIFYDWINDGPDSANGENRYGILRQGLAPKPAFTAIAEFLRRLRGYTFRRRIRGAAFSDYRLLFQGPAGLAVVTWTSSESAPLAAQTPRIALVGKHDADYAGLLRIALLKTSPDDLPYPDTLPHVPGIVTVLTSATAPQAPPPQGNHTVPADLSEPLVNPGFEAGTEGWSASTIERGKRIGITNAVSHTGDKSAFMSADPDTAPTWFSWAQTVTPVTPGDRYTFTAWVKVEDTRGPSGWFIHVNGAGGAMPFNNVLTTPAGYSVWQRITQTFTVPSGGASITIGTSMYGSGVAFFDDASLKRIGHVQ